MNDERNSHLYAAYREMAGTQPNVLFGGRLGQYTYADMDDTVAAALEMARKVFGQ